MVPRSPSPLARRERRLSVSSRSSKSSRRKVEVVASPEYRQVIVSPQYDSEYERKKRKRRDKKHKKDKKVKKKKRKSKHRSRSTSLDSPDSESTALTPPRKIVKTIENSKDDALSDWEATQAPPIRYILLIISNQLQDLKHI